MENDKILHTIYFNNTIQDYLIFLFIAFLGVIGLRVLRKIVQAKLSHTNLLFGQYYLKIESNLYALVLLLIVYTAFHWLTLPKKMQAFTGYAFTVAFCFLIIRLLSASIKNAIYSYLASHDGTAEKIKQVTGIVLILNGILWTIGLIFLFDNFGFNVTAILTGLGVGGIAIALAAQTILGDIFNYFVIFFDRPFEVGDFIVVDDKLGVVEYIGLKTTRLKSLQGEQIVFSNSNLTNSRIHNYKRMAERRILFRMGVVYSTGKKKLEAIPNIIKNIIIQRSNTRFDRAHFASYGDFSLNFEIVYFILSSDYNQYMDIQQQINLSLYEEFENQKIEFAFPTYTINSNGFIVSPKNGRRFQLNDQ
jgi:small-conductance mechanosensitive channel